VDMCITVCFAATKSLLQRKITTIYINRWLTVVLQGRQNTDLDNAQS